MDAEGSSNERQCTMLAAAGAQTEHLDGEPAVNDHPKIYTGIEWQTEL